LKLSSFLFLTFILNLFFSSSRHTQKFIMDADGVPVRRYQPGIDPEQMEGDIKSLLAGKKLPSARKTSLNEY